MCILCFRLALCLLAVLNGTTTISAAHRPFAFLHPLIEPSTNVQAGVGLGDSVAVDGNIAVVGAPFDDTGATNSGLVRVFDVTSGALLHTLTNPSPAAYDYFGASVSISDKRVVVGAYWDDTGAPEAGSAYVYDLAAAIPTGLVATLTNPSPRSSYAFGVSTAISGTRVVVGASNYDIGSGEAGRAYVYDLAAGMPMVPVVTLSNASPVMRSEVGWAVAISGRYVVVGAHSDGSGAKYAGIARVYDLAGATPALPVATLTNPSPAALDYFGYSVAISGTWIAVSAIYDDTGAFDAGIVYAYDLASSRPIVPVAALTNPHPEGSSSFGVSVSISAAHVVVGAPYEDAGATNAGRAYVFNLAGGTPTIPMAVLDNPLPAYRDQFGSSVAIHGSTIVVGAPFDDTTAPDSGAAYIFGPWPSLSIALSTPGFATLSWTPATSSGFALQYADGLAPSNWLNAPSGVANPVTISFTNAARFHRLIQQ